MPLILFKTRAEFERQDIVPDADLGGISSFAEPERDRIVLLIDGEAGPLDRRITHELTHIFAFDIIPRSPIRSSIPVWVDEGLADYMTAASEREDLDQLRDLVTAGGVPKMTALVGAPSRPRRLPYNLGHAVFDFIEASYGKAGVRQFLLELRRDAVDGTDDLGYQAAFQLTPNEFDEAFERYLKERFPRVG